MTARLATTADIPALLAMLDAMGQAWSEEAVLERIADGGSVVVIHETAGEPDAFSMVRFRPTASVGPVGGNPGNNMRPWLEMWVATDDEVRRRVPDFDDSILVEFDMWSAPIRRLVTRRLSLDRPEAGEGVSDMPDGRQRFRFRWRRLIARIRERA